MILAFGCSVTHGVGLVSDQATVENLKFSYPNLIAKQLGVDCVNFAFPGNSNENIFYKMIEEIPKHKNITAVIAGWTSPVREVWTSEGRTWQFIPNWCATTTDLTKPFARFKNVGVWTPNTPCICADSEDKIDTVFRLYQLLLTYKFDDAEYRKKRDLLITATRAYCQLNKVKLIETSWSDIIGGVDIRIDTISPWVNEVRHPNRQEHELVAKKIIEAYKL